MPPKSLVSIGAVSALGAEDVDVVRDNIDICYSSANKCLHSVSGVSFLCVAPQVWERIGGDGNLTARVWLAPSLHHVMVKMRLSNGRITGEALLDSIRVDETVAQR